MDIYVLEMTTRASSGFSKPCQIKLSFQKIILSIGKNKKKLFAIQKNFSLLLLSLSDLASIAITEQTLTTFINVLLQFLRLQRMIKKFAENTLKSVSCLCYCAKTKHHYSGYMCLEKFSSKRIDF